MNNRQLEAAILDAATTLARRKGLHNLKQADVAKLAGAAHGTISYHFNSMDGLRTAVLDRAIERQDLQLIAQGLVHKHPSMRRVSEDLRRRAALCIA